MRQGTSPTRRLTFRSSDSRLIPSTLRPAFRLRFQPVQRPTDRSILSPFFVSLHQSSCPPLDRSSVRGPPSPSRRLRIVLATLFHTAPSSLSASGPPSPRFPRSSQYPRPLCLRHWICVPKREVIAQLQVCCPSPVPSLGFVPGPSLTTSTTHRHNIHGYSLPNPSLPAPRLVRYILALVSWNPGVLAPVKFVLVAGSRQTEISYASRPSAPATFTFQSNLRPTHGTSRLVLGRADNNAELFAFDVSGRLSEVRSSQRAA